MGIFERKWFVALSLLAMGVGATLERVRILQHAEDLFEMWFPATTVPWKGDEAVVQEPVVQEPVIALDYDGNPIKIERDGGRHIKFYNNYPDFVTLYWWDAVKKKEVVIHDSMENGGVFGKFSFR